MEIPPVRDLMTPAPRVVDAMEDCKTARALMGQFGVRHLPVMKDGELFGVLSERDLRGVEAFLSGSPGEIGPPVMAVCGREPFVVGPDDALDQTAIEMANRRLGAALVADGERLVGIVTTVDLCRELAKLLGRLKTATS